jgi:hypothetical protein
MSVAAGEYTDRHTAAKKTLRDRHNLARVDEVRVGDATGIGDPLIYLLPSP